MFLDVVSVGEMFKVVSCHPICFKKGTFKKKNPIYSRRWTSIILLGENIARVANAVQAWLSITNLNVLMQVLQFVINSQLSVSLCLSVPVPDPDSVFFCANKIIKIVYEIFLVTISNWYIHHLFLQSSMSLSFQMCTSLSLSTLNHLLSWSGQLII